MAKDGICSKISKTLTITKPQGLSHVCDPFVLINTIISNPAAAHRAPGHSHLPRGKLVRFIWTQNLDTNPPNNITDAQNFH